ncbi:hypothetical protein ACYOEI_27080, partial [Singulisphaera rosea]
AQTLGHRLPQRRFHASQLSRHGQLPSQTSLRAAGVSGAGRQGTVHQPGWICLSTFTLSKS